MHPTLGHGKICYLVLPARDVAVSAAFYESVFGWNVRRRANGEVSFDDGVGEVSGTWVPGDTPVDASFVHIMTSDMERTCDALTRSGGSVLERSPAGAPEITAVFRDPAGNRFGLYQDRSLRTQP